MQRGSWNEVLARGMGQFVWRYGVVCFGGLFFLASTPVRWLSINPDLRHDSGSVTALIAISFVYCISVGTAFGFVAWHALRTIHFLSCRPVSSLKSAPVVAKSLSAAANK
jgi:hypothetical protein